MPIDEDFSKEKRILMAMRKTLAQIVKEVTPESAALRSPLSTETIEDIRMCFGLISARERELADQAGIDIKEKPHFIDEPQQTTSISIESLKK